MTSASVYGWTCPDCRRFVAAKLVTCPRCSTRNPDAPPDPEPEPADPRILAPVADAPPPPARSSQPLSYGGGGRQGVDWATWGGRVARGFSLRVIFFSIVGGIAVSVLIQLVWKSAPLWLMWPLIALFYLAAVFNDEQMIKCRACGKRVKLGYSTCHHCGYSLG